MGTPHHTVSSHSRVLRRHRASGHPPRIRDLILLIFFFFLCILLLGIFLLFFPRRQAELFPVAPVGSTVSLQFSPSTSYGTVSLSFGTSLPQPVSSSISQMVSLYFPRGTTYLRFHNASSQTLLPSLSSLQSPRFPLLFSFSQNSAVMPFLTDYFSTYTSSPTVEITSYDDAFITTLGSSFPTVSVVTTGEAWFSKSRVENVFSRTPPPDIAAFSFTIPEQDISDLFGSIKGGFDVMYDANAVNGISYPTGSVLMISSITVSTPEQQKVVSYQTGILSSAVVSHVQQNGRSGKAPIMSALWGNLSTMSEEEKTVLSYFADFSSSHPQLVWPFAHPGNGDPWDNPVLSQSYSKPIVGVIGTLPNRLAILLTNTSSSRTAVNFPSGTHLTSYEFYSNVRGAGYFASSAQQLIFEPYETLISTSGVAAIPSPTPTPLPPSPSPTSALFPPPTPTVTIPLLPSPTPTPAGPSPTPTPTLIRLATKTPTPIILNIPVTIPVLAVKLGQPSPIQNFSNWLSVVIRIVFSPFSPPSPPPLAQAPSLTPTPFLQAPIPSLTATPPVLPPSSSVTPTPPSIACPTFSTHTYHTLTESLPSYPEGDPAPPQHPDLNLALRGYSPTTGTLSLLDLPGSTAPIVPPQLMTLFRGHTTPQISNLSQIHDWNWGGSIGPGGLLVGIASIPGETLYPPYSDYIIGEDLPVSTDPFQVFVLYAETHRLVLKYDRTDSVATGFTLHLENICVDPNLLSMCSSRNYNNPSYRTTLLALRTRDSLGVAKTSYVAVAIRANGAFMDPRSRKDWWQGY